MGKITLKDLDIDFDEVRILLPGNSGIKEKISKFLTINKDVPAEVLEKMANCSAKFARWGMVSADLSEYLEELREDFDIFEKRIMKFARGNMEGKPSEGAIREEAVLKKVNTEEYISKRKQIRKVEKAIYKVKKVMKALEMMSEMARSITSYAKKEWEMTQSEPTVKGGSLKNIK